MAGTDWMDEAFTAVASGALLGLTASQVADELGIEFHKAAVLRALMADGVNATNQRVRNNHRAAWVRLQRGEEPAVPRPVADHRVEAFSAEEIIAARLATQDRRHARLRSENVRSVQIEEEGPIGLMMMGDPHLDDEGTDLRLVTEHVDIIKRTPGCYAVCVGDLSNNWPMGGRLAKKHADQSVTREQEKKLVRWFLDTLRDRWAGLVIGNHDLWNNDKAWLSSVLNPDVYPVGNDELRVRLNFPRGTYGIHIRHDFKGGSMYSTTHAPFKAALMGRDNFDLYVCGHRHVWGLRSEPLKNREAALAMRLGAYKLHDEYAVTLGHRDGVPGGEAAFVIVRPWRQGPSRHEVFWDVESGADYLRWLRTRGSKTDEAA